MNSSYALENENENYRLEKQNQMVAYDFRHELPYLQVPNGSIVLDAGCGSGIVLRTLSQKFQNLNLFGIDISEDRIQQLEQEIPSLLGSSTLELSNQNIEALDFHSNTFDIVINRFVLEHLAQPQRAIEELLRVCKPMGKLYIIDGDGVFFNLYTQNKKLNKYLEILRKKVPFDLYIGRKIPSMLKTAGARNISYHVQPMYFKAEDLKREKQNYIRRFKQIHPFLLQWLDGEKKVEEFIRLYLSEMSKEGSTLFYNKFIVKAEK